MSDPNPHAEDSEDDLRIAKLVEHVRHARDPAADLLRPLPPTVRQAMADRALATLPAPRRARRARLVWALPAAAALAAAVTVALIPREAPLVAYRVQVEGDADQRGEPTLEEAPVRLRPETKLHVRLLPAAPARDVTLRLIVVRDGRTTVISPPAMQDGQGAFTLEQPAGTLLGEQVDGKVELVFAVGRPLPADETLVRLAMDGTARVPPSVRILRRTAVLVGFSPRHGALGFAGCKALRAGPVCEVEPETRLRVWAEGADPARFTLRVDGHEVSTPPAAVEGGLRWTAPSGSQALTLALGGREILRVALTPVLRSEPIEAAETLLQEGKLDDAEVRLAEVGEAHEALRLRARIARRRGDRALTAALREQAITADRASGRISEEVDDQVARVFDLIFEDHALGEAARRLDALPPLPDGDAEDRVKVDYYRGLLAGEVGDLRRAVAALRAARVGARRLAVPAYEAAVLAPLSDLLGVLGRYDEVADILGEMEQGLSAAADPCERANLGMNHGWVLLRTGATEEAGRRLEEAARLTATGCPRLRGEALTNLAFARHEAGAAAEARALLDEARAARRASQAWTAVWQERLAIELALGDDPAGALAAAEKVREAANASLSPELLFEAEFGRARALDRLGDQAAAARAHAAAEEALDAWASLVPLGEGRQAFLDRQERGARAWLDFLRRREPDPARALGWTARRSLARFHRLLHDGDRAGALSPDDAGAAFRAARARVDASLAEGRRPAAEDLATLKRHRRSAVPHGDAPPAPPAGELSLVYHPLPKGWLGVAETIDGATFAELGPVDPTASPASLAVTLLRPFHDALVRAHTVRVYAHRALSGVAFAGLPWEDGTLLGRAAVLEGVDLPASPSRAACVGPAAALLVADPRGNLAGAAAVAGEVAEALAGRGLLVRRLRGDEATTTAVKQALSDPCVQLFHYEGHAVFGGRDGILARLILADGALGAGEILGLSRVPEQVVLSGCSTAEAEGLGLAHAFLARGAAEVLATASPVEDALAAQVARRLYEPGSPRRLALAWQRAFSRLRRDGGRIPDLFAYRVLGC